MRESFGGAFMIKLVLVFIVIYISFMAVAVNYAKAFRVKNNVINILEQNQFVITDNDVIAQVDNYLKGVPYNLNGNASVSKNCNNVSFASVNTNLTNPTALTEYGVCIQQMSSDVNSNRVYYKVTTYISVEFPLFDIYMTLPISGETKMIVY